MTISTERHREHFEFGIHTFGDVTKTPDGQRELSQPEVLRNVLAEATLADQVGIDVVGIGEHHRPDYAISAPDVVLAAVGAATERIKLISAVTVLSSDDPVRVYQRFATIDGLTGGRAEVSLGRGSFIESYPLFGYDLSDYEQLFEEKVELFAALRSEGSITWEGQTRAPLKAQEIFPKTDHEHGLPTWIAVGGTPNSVVRAARHGVGLELAIIGGAPGRFAPFVELYKRALAEFGQPEELRVASHSHGFVAETDQRAQEIFYPSWAESMAKLGKERGWGNGFPSFDQFQQEITHGALFVGSPETVAEKIVKTQKQLGITRFGLKYGNGSLAHEHMMEAIELYGTKVKPLVLDRLQG
ncbi:LLM class flavin-dependent oxidoreductase [Nesterenkonia alkaliphila]|uniref:LLM class flavin-dependent oxidoreductase n=1 Tax=Nesterenkonia alkaliphila TaxID=1463631 RepID=A0A7K1UHW7_9MICC|nr:LLM class flavin-dependent oxidoreductase [Nesterenkonia alkaliphila]MVT26067.1 LLM class flavin-dependent oxidoreductase [Nesterenkonia alkaliphila]GFZ86486.1 oxidoreductase [Nesterenkonia alkaliphila]